MRNSVFQQQANSVTSHVLEQIRDDSENLWGYLAKNTLHVNKLFQHMLLFLRYKHTKNIHS